MVVFHASCRAFPGVLKLLAINGIGFPWLSYKAHNAVSAFSLTHSIRLSFSPSKWLNSARSCSIQITLIKATAFIMSANIKDVT
ncbi:Uncharacterised protein [Shigella sonnei]|nr:Uncharacterised protein [Shigella sonnei]